MARITDKKIVSILFLGLLSFVSTAYAVNPKEVIKDLFNSKAGGKAIDDSEGKNLDKFMKPNQCRRHQTWGGPRLKDEIVQDRSLFICRGNFSIQFDPKLKVPLWTSENINQRVFLDKRTELDSKFMPDKDLPSKMQTYPEDYINSIYTPVQLATVYNIRNDDLKNRDPRFVQEHFNFSNTVPMVRENMANTIWLDLENHVRSLLKKKDILYITTGSIYFNGQTNGKLEKSQTLIPTHFYKILTHPHTHGTVSYIIPNKEIFTAKSKKFNNTKNVFTCNGGPCNINNFIVPIQEVERLTNTEFYPWLAPQYAVKVKLDANETFKYQKREAEGQ